MGRRSFKGVGDRRSVAVGVVAVIGALSCAAATAADGASWGYERVTPTVKGGGVVHPIDTFQAREDGNAFLWSASGAFAGILTESTPLYTRYIATRTDSGWANLAVDPPYQPIIPNSDSALMATVGTSRNLRFAVVVSTMALAPGATEGGGNVYLRDLVTGSYTVVATNPNPALTAQFARPSGAASVKYVGNEGDDVVFDHYVPLVPGAPDGTVDRQDGAAVYHWKRGKGISAVSLLPLDQGGGFVEIATAIGNVGEQPARDSLPASDGASRIYFNSSTRDTASGPVYVREGNASRRISESRIVDDPPGGVPGNVIATTSGGRFMVFTAATRLTADTPLDLDRASKYIYRYAADGDQLTFVGALGGGVNSDDKSVLQMSDDGKSIVFVSTLELADGAVETRQNVYFWRDGKLHLVAVPDVENLITYGQNSLRLLSPNGRYFSFTDNSPSIAARFGFGNLGPCGTDSGGGVAPCGQVYLYDVDGAVGEGELTCVSCRVDGEAPRGNAGDPSNPNAGIVRMNAHQTRTVIDDGSVFFASPDDLVDADSNGLADVYRYRGGRLDLVSRGAQGASARLLDVTPDGNSVFFSTDDRIVKSDTDRAVDIYVARIGGGFPDPDESAQPPCSGADCRSGAPFRAVAGVAGSSAPMPSSKMNVPRPPRVSVRLRRIGRVGGRARIELDVSAPGAVRVSGAGLRSTGRTLRRAGSATIVAPLTPKSIRAITRSGRKSIRVRVSLTPAFGRPSAIAKRMTVRK